MCVCVWVWVRVRACECESECVRESVCECTKKCLWASMWVCVCVGECVEGECGCECVHKEWVMGDTHTHLLNHITHIHTNTLTHTLRCTHTRAHTHTHTHIYIYIYAREWVDFQRRHPYIYIYIYAWPKFLKTHLKISKKKFWTYDFRECRKLCFDDLVLILKNFFSFTDDFVKSAEEFGHSTIPHAKPLGKNGQIVN